jgi:hypothetical protein
MRLFSNFLNKALSSIVSVAMVVTTIPLTVPRVVAAPVCYNAYAADSGQDPNCAGTRIGGQTIAYPKLQWQRVSDMPLAATSGSTVAATGGNEAIQLANRSAAALGLSASDVASVVTLFPANVPYIFARYDPLDGTLRVDIFKLEKTISNGQKLAGLYRASFAPGNGDFWKASRSYITPDAFKSAMTPGVNPFAAFQQGSDDIFHNISLSAAQVAVGHAMRYAGAPVAVLEVADTRFSQETQKSGGVFRKTVTTIVRGHAKPKWFIAQPTAFMQRSTTLPMAGYCAPDPSRTDCALYETATSGVSFEEFDGGMLSKAEDTWELDRQSQSGWGFLAILVVAVVASFALAAIGPALMSAAGAGGAATTAAGATMGASAGLFGSALIGGEIVSGLTLAGAIAVETAAYATALALVSGANLSSVMAMGPGVVFAHASVSKGTADLASMDEMTRRLNSHVSPTTTGDFTQGAPLLTGFSQTVVGTCAPGTPLSQCAGATGVVQHVDQYNEHNMVNFVRDNNGLIVRDGSTPGTGH